MVFYKNWAGIIGLYILTSMLLTACSSGGEVKEEHIRISNSDLEMDQHDSTHINSIQGNLSLNQIPTAPNDVVLTGLPQHRLVTIYKSKIISKANPEYSFMKNRYYDSYDEHEQHFMPGLDLIHGYNLLNVAHFNLESDQLNYLFQHPVLIKSLYYPSFEQDSLYKKPINRDYYLVSVYDADTNADSLINKRDLRRMYYFNAANTEKSQIVPADYSVVRSDYDPMNDVMYIFAQQDSNHNGAVEKNEPHHIFWINLKSPAKAKRLY